MHVSYQSIERLARNHMVLLRTKLRGNALAKEDLSSDLEGDSGTKRDPGELEEVSDNVEIPGGEDEGDDTGVDNGGGT